MRKTTGKRRISIQKIQDKSKKHVAFSKRRMGLFKKASELCTLCGSEIAIITFSEAGKVFSFGHPNADSVIQRYLNGYSSFSSSSLGFPSVQSDSDPLFWNQINKSLPQTVCLGYSNIAENGGRFSWDRPVNSMGLEELGLYAKSLELLMNHVAAKATSMGNSFSDVAAENMALETAVVYPSAMNDSKQEIEVANDLGLEEQRSAVYVNGAAAKDKVFDGLTLDDLELDLKYLEELNTDAESTCNGVGESLPIESLSWELGGLRKPWWA